MLRDTQDADPLPAPPSVQRANHQTFLFKSISSLHEEQQTECFGWPLGWSNPTWEAMLSKSIFKTSKTRWMHCSLLSAAPILRAINGIICSKWLLLSCFGLLSELLCHLRSCQARIEGRNHGDSVFFPHFEMPQLSCSGGFHHMETPGPSTKFHSTDRTDLSQLVSTKANHAALGDGWWIKKVNK